MRLGSAFSLVVVALTTAGCATTMQTAARLQLNDARIRAAEVPTVVRTPGHAVHVTGVTLLRHGSETAFVVSVRNAGERPVTDLPVTVGVRTGRHRRQLLNAGSTGAFFQSHLPVIPAGSQLRWVLTSGRRLPAHARPFAVVGESPSTAARPGRSLPAVWVNEATGPVGRAPRPGSMTVVVSNLSSIPQYQLQVYAVASRAGRPVAAGALTVAFLGAGARVRVGLALVGAPHSTRLQAQAFPTIFH